MSVVQSESDRWGEGAAWESAHPDYPRKQFRRAGWKSLNGRWRFAFDDQRKFRHPREVGWNREIDVPFAPESRRSGIGDEGFHPICWYQRDFEHRQSAGRTFLRFGAVDYRAQVWVNGQYVGSHEGGHTPFSFDITDVLSESAAQTVSVCAEDDPHDLAKPRGKQDWKLNPHSIWYPRTSGIWQTVWIEDVPELHIDRVRWTPLLERWEIGCEAFINGNLKPGLELRVMLRVRDQLLANDRYEVIRDEVHRRIGLSDPGVDDYRNELLWTPEEPTLIEAWLELSCAGEILDRARSYTALRRVALQQDRFTLNNRPYYLRMVLDQGYWPDTLMTPPSQEAIVQDIAIAKAAGFNGVRKHQKIEDPNYLYWADVMGLVVWEEMPSAYRFTNESVRRLIKEWVEAIDRDSSHPCIVTWVPFNESWGVPDLPDKETHQSCVQALFHLTKTMDPSRPVVGNDGWESSSTHILGIHDYDRDPHRIFKRYGDRAHYQELLRRGRPGGRVLSLEGHSHDEHPVMLTEFGGIACRDPRDGSLRETWGYSIGESPDDFRRRYEELMAVINKIGLFCGFCYTQLTDTFQEGNGLFYADRTPKFPVEAMRAATLGTGEARGDFLAPPARSPEIEA